MSRLSERLKEAKNPTKKSNMDLWLESLSDEDRKAVLDAAKDENLKNYTLYGILRQEGLKVSKDTFIKWRDAQLGVMVV